MVYIRLEKLPKLKEYKYSGVDRSLVSRYVLKPIYSYVILLFPMSMAPNLITLSGFSFVIANLLTLLYWSPTLDVDCPSWVYYSWAAGLLLYQTFDAIDGSQARRTHQSGPLGELFDHGVDALNTTLECLIFSATMNLGQSWKTVVLQCASLLTFYVQTWDEYHTKTLTLGIVSGPVEGILTLVIVYALTGYFGCGSFWNKSMLQCLGFDQWSWLPQSIYNLSWVDSYMAYGGIMLVVNTMWSAQNVIKARREREKNPMAALYGLLPFFGVWTLILVYLALNPLVLRDHLIPFAFFVGIVNAYSVGQMIVAHVTQSPFPYYNILTLPLLFGIVDSMGPVLQEHVGFGWPSALGHDVYQISYMFACLGVAIGVYGSFVIDVIYSICDYLDIWCLTIKHPYVEKAEPKKIQ